MQTIPDSPLPEWRRAYDSPSFSGLVKNSNSDFEVTEILGFTPSGEGEHEFLYVQKDGANTVWVAERLAQFAGVAKVDVGFAGLKDRNAVTRQWFSVKTKQDLKWRDFAAPGVVILENTRHARKLKRGAHEANQFRIAIRDINASEAELAPWLALLRDSGVPNYFGQQRFGHGGRNLELFRQLTGGRRLRRQQRSIAISAARSFLFNEILSARIGEGTWNAMVPGEALQLAGTNSVFVADELTDELTHRLASFDIHPSAAMWGQGEPMNRGPSAAFEQAIVQENQSLCDGLLAAGVRQARRATRLVVQELSWRHEEETLWLEFSLVKGAYATSVLRELVN